jgi:SpoVK/Ycf46/Vps4 family AAA+-type ATPase
MTEKKIRDVFAYARAFKALHGFPLTVFIDEADAILPGRDGSGRPAAVL